jgi:hypothetical protein
MARTTTRPTLTNSSYWQKSDAVLRFILKDASDAADCMLGMDPVAEAKYLEQMADAETVLASRRGGR